MSNIRSLKDYSESEKKRKRIGGIVIIVLLLLSTVGFAFSLVGFGDNGTNNEDIQGFSSNGQYWVYTVGSQKYLFTHHPDEINYTFSISKTLADFGNKQVYIDSEIPGGLQEVYNSLGAYTGKIGEACYGSCEKDLVEKDCSGFETLIVMRESEIEQITEDRSCIFINGNIKTVDAFLYKILGISGSN